MLFGTNYLMKGSVRYFFGLRAPYKICGGNKGPVNQEILVNAAVQP